MSKVVIGLVGPIASGKGTISEFLVTKGFKYFSLSDVVREETRKRGLVVNRTNLQDVGNELRKQFGGAVLVERISNQVKDNELVVIDGVRNPYEVKYIKEQLDGDILHISASKDNRLNRYIARAKSRNEGEVSKDKFKQIDARDLGQGEDSKGQQVAECIKLADFRIVNNSSIDDFYLKCQEKLGV